MAEEKRVDATDEPPTKLVRVELTATAPLHWTAVVRVPGGADQATVDRMVDRLRYATPTSQYQAAGPPEPTGGSSRPGDPGDVAQFTLAIDGDVATLEPVSIEDQIRARLRLLSEAAEPLTDPVAIMLFSPRGAGRWLSCLANLTSMLSDKAFTFNRGQAERLVSEFPAFFTDGSYQIRELKGKP